MGPGPLGALTSPRPPAAFPEALPVGPVAPRPRARTRPGRGTARHGSGCSGTVCRGFCAVRDTGVRCPRRRASCRTGPGRSLRPPWREKGLIPHSSRGSKAAMPPDSRHLAPGAAVEDPAAGLRRRQRPSAARIHAFARFDRTVQIEDRDGTQQRFRRDPANSGGGLHFRDGSERRLLRRSRRFRGERQGIARQSSPGPNRCRRT